MKLKHSIYIMIFLSSFIPVCIWILFSMYDSQQRIETVVTNNIESIGGSQALSIQNFCEGRKESMETISRMALVKRAILNYETEGHSDELDTFLKDNEKQKTYIASISIVDEDFNVVGSSQNYEEYSVSDFQYSRAEYKSGVFVMGDVYTRKTDSGTKRMIPAFIGVFHEAELIGYLIVEIDCDYFNRLRLQTDFLEAGTLYLLDGEQQIITAGTAKEEVSREDLVTTDEQRQNYNEAWNEFDHEQYAEGVIYYEVDNQKYMTYFADISYTDWTIRISENMTAQLKSNQTVYLAIVLEGIAVIGILVYVQILITRKLVAPFNKIINILKEVQNKHDYSLRTRISEKGEVGIVSKGIDELLDYIERAELEEKRKHREFEQKSNEEAEKLQHKEFLSNTMLENMPSGYHRCLPDAEKGFPFIQLGSHFEEILGWTAEEIRDDLGNCYKNLIWPEDLDIAFTYTEMMTKVGSGNKYDTSVYRMKHKDGGYRWITDATMFVDLGEESFFQGVIADITTYVEGIEEAKSLAEASSHAKSDFLTQMSHDIRTPMNAIIGFNNLAKNTDDLSVIKDEYLPKIETASSQLLMLIDDVLEMNSIERGKIVFHKSPQNLVKLVNNIMTIMQLQTQERELSLVSDVHVTDEYVYLDENRFNRVFMNLMSNAIKFTKANGIIRILVEQKNVLEDNYATFVFKVSDTGIGMSPEFLPHIFEPFERERTSTVSRVEGTGLGMAIVKSIVDAAGGTISVESMLDIGTTFTIKLQLALVEPEVIEKLQESQQEELQEVRSTVNMKEYFSEKRILLVEDNEFNRMIAQEILESVGFTVEVAEDGDIAVNKVRYAPYANYYDVIMMDIQMPTMNGYEATKAIREMSDERRNTKIIAVTANAFESDKEKAKEAGMNAHISKPIDVEILYQTLLQMGNKKG